MKIMHGDLLDITSGILVHQVNCLGVMGAGIARAIKKQWPVVFDEYAKLCESTHCLGRIQLVAVSPKLTVCNLFGQDGIGDGVQTDYAAVEEAMRDLAAASSGRKVYFPYKIGCGLGGGDWKTYVGIIAKYIPDATIVFLSPKDLDDEWVNATETYCRAKNKVKQAQEQLDKALAEQAVAKQQLDDYMK